MQLARPFESPVVVALDPGLTTGVAMYRHGNLPGLDAPFSSGQIEGRFAFYDTFAEIVGMGAPLVVVCERFTITGATASKSQQLDPLYIIGHIEGLCHKLGAEFHLQTPAQAKGFATNDKLQAVGFYEPGKDHANDAARHALRFVIDKKADGHAELLHSILQAQSA